jgi:hypothetical protein
MEEDRGNVRGCAVLTTSTAGASSEHQHCSLLCCLQLFIPHFMLMVENIDMGITCMPSVH